MSSSSLTDLLALFAAQLAAEPAAVTEERVAVRRFLTEAQDSGRLTPICDSWMSGFSPEFSRELGARGWIGMTFPEQYGGRGLSREARLAVIEELLAAGAPIAAHWFADRQVGPSLLAHGTTSQREQFLPAIVRGELFFCIGMSEPESGSDLSSVSTRGTRTSSGWVVNGSKIWTSHAAKAQFMLALIRTGEPAEKATTALTQVLIDMNAPGLTVRPISMMGGHSDFCEVFLDDVPVPDEMVVGEVGGGWHQVLSELVYERSGPERFLSTFPLLREFDGALARDGESDSELGAALARIHTLRRMSASVTASLDGSPSAGVAAALVKDLGTRTELETMEIAAARRARSESANWDAVDVHLRAARRHGPGFTIRGGTNEILRGIIARSVVTR
jgi:acyl-CoA dehydrogenase